MELYLWVAANADKTFEVHRAFYPSDQFARDSVLKLDYNYTPWIRENGNLLWTI